MHISHLLGAAAVAVVAVVLLGDRTAAPQSPLDRAAAAPASQPADPIAPIAPAVANGHSVLVVEGARNGLGATFASRKQAPWAGVPKGFDSNWRLSVVDARGVELADVPLDVRPIATDPASLGKPATVRGCIVVDSRIGMLVNVPCYAEADRYRFTRIDPRGVEVPLGVVAGSKVRELAGGGR
jgi:hypothetical protein